MDQAILQAARDVRDEQISVGRGCEEILIQLGWDLREIRPIPGSSNLCLTSGNGRRSVLIACRSPKAVFDPPHPLPAQLAHHALDRKAQFAVLSNGRYWDLHFPYRGSRNLHLKDLRFARADLLGEDPLPALHILRRCLERNAVLSGQAACSALEFTLSG